MVNGTQFNPFGEQKTGKEEPFGEPEPFGWLRGGRLQLREIGNKTSSADRDLAKAQIVQMVSGGTESYLPLDTEPDLYLEFAAIGKKSWQLRKSDTSDAHDEETRWAVELTERFGILSVGAIGSDAFLNAWKYDTTEEVFPSVWDVISEARAVALILQGHQFSTEGNAEAGREYSYLREKGFDLDGSFFGAIMAEHELDPTEMVSGRKKLAQHYVWSDKSIDQYRMFVASDIAGLVNMRLQEEDVQPLVGSSINFGAVVSGSVQIAPVWNRKFHISTLRAAIWVQVANHLLSGAMWRKCQNSACRRGVFGVERPKSKQRYCDQYCKEQQNNRDKYHKHPERYARKKS
jgi:hypothetical protein